MVLSLAISDDLVDLFQRDGVFYARVQHAFSAEPFEIALRGIATEEEARIAVEALKSPPLNGSSAILYDPE